MKERKKDGKKELRVRQRKIEYKYEKWWRRKECIKQNGERLEEEKTLKSNGKNKETRRNEKERKKKTKERGEEEKRNEGWDEFRTWKRKNKRN